MKIITLAIVFVFSAYSGSLAQPVLPLDFESTAISYTFTNFNGGAVTKIANPQINGINTSATVAKMVKGAGEVWGGSYITMASPVNFSTNKIFKVKVFSPVVGKKLLLKFEGAGAAFEKESIGVTTANVWQELTFDFTGVAGVNNLNNKIVFIFDLGMQGDGSANSTYLFDDVVQTSTGDYSLVWSDEFSGTGLPDTDLWFHQTQLPAGGSWYNGEQQHYTNRIQNTNVDNGILKIVAKKESFTDQGQTKQYTSARLNSKYAFTYGRVDVRAKLPVGAGTWPAIWMLGKNINEPGGYFASQFGTTNWPATGEIDIMEHWGNNPNVIHQSIHTPSNFGATINTSTTTISSVSTTFHVYSIIWDESKIQFLVDEVAYYTYNPADKDGSTWPFNNPQYLLLNIAMGGIGGTIDPAFTESNMEVDYVRVYQKGVTPLNNQTITFPAIEDKTVGNAPFALTATASSTLPVSYSTVSDKATISGSTVTIVKAGREIIKANQAGNVTFSAAPEAMQSFCIKPAQPTITITGTITETIILTSSAAEGNTWFLNGTAIPSATNSTFSATATGIYIVQVTVDDCMSEFSADTPVIVTGDLREYSYSVNAYPNPVENILEVSGIKGSLSNVQLLDLAGRKKSIEFEKQGDVYQANVQHLAAGIYLLQVEQKSVTHRIKVVKK